MGKTIFVLSGGGSQGSIQVGMLKALYERGIVPDEIIGTSVGAVNGAFVASRPQTVQTIQELETLWRGLRRRDVFPLSPARGLMGLVGADSGFVPAHALRKLVADNARMKRLEDGYVPLHVIATEILTGLEVCLSKGELVPAVLASAAIPAVFPPVEIDGVALVDGGVSNNAPISHCTTLGADTIYVLPSGNACALSQPPRTPLGVGLHAMTLLVMQRLFLDVEQYTGSAELIVLPPPCPLSVSPIDFSKTDELIRRGYDDSRQYLDKLEIGEAEAPLRMAHHRH